MYRRTTDAAAQRAHPAKREVLALWRVVALGSFSMAAAGPAFALSPGALQAKDSDLLTAFAGLWGIGEVAFVIAVLLWAVPVFSTLQAGVRTSIRVGAASLGIFGSASMLFSALATRTWPSASHHDFLVPMVLAAAALAALVASLGTPENTLARTLARERRPWRAALAAAFWVTALIVFIGVPVAGAWSLVWHRTGTAMPNMSAGIASLLASRYWSLGCLSGNGGCGSAVNSIGLGVIVSTLAGALGLSLALFVHRSNRKLRKWVAVLVCLPMITPPFLVGLGLAQLFGQAGIVTIVLEATLGITRSRWFFGGYGVMMAQVLVFFPLAYFLLLNALDSLGREQIDAAKFLGASDTDVLRTVILPALRDPLAVAMLVVFVETLSDIGNPLVIGGKLRVLATELFYSSSTEIASGEMTGVPALLLVGIALTMAVVKEYLARHRWRGNTTLPESRERCRYELPAPLRGIFGALLTLCVLTLVAIYVLLVVGAFSEGGIADRSFTLENFVRGFGVLVAQDGVHLTGSGWDSLIASLSCAFLIAPLGGVIGMAMVWVLQRGGLRGARTIESISSYILSVPSVVIGAGFLLAFGRFGLTSVGAWTLILLAMLLRNLAVCMRFGGVALRRMDSAQIEMSGLFGAGALTTFAKVVAPTLRSTFVVSVAYGFVRSMTMLGSVLLLSSAENQVATTYMIDRIGIGEFGVGMAYGVVLAACIGTVLAIGWMVASARRTVPGLGAALSDLKAAVVLAQKDGLAR